MTRSSLAVEAGGEGPAEEEGGKEEEEDLVREIHRPTDVVTDGSLRWVEVC